MRPWRAFHPSNDAAFEGLATLTATSPGRRLTIRWGIDLPKVRSKAPVTSGHGASISGSQVYRLYPLHAVERA